MVDANQAWTYFPPYWDRKTALKVAKELEKYDVLWLEEPLPITDLKGYAELRKNTSVMIAGGELEYGLFRIRELLENECFRHNTARSKSKWRVNRNEENSSTC